MAVPEDVALCRGRVAYRRRSRPSRRLLRDDVAGPARRPVRAGPAGLAGGRRVAEVEHDADHQRRIRALPGQRVAAVVLRFAGADEVVLEEGRQPRLGTLGADPGAAEFITDRVAAAELVEAQQHADLGARSGSAGGGREERREQCEQGDRCRGSAGAVHPRYRRRPRITLSRPRQDSKVPSPSPERDLVRGSPIAITTPGRKTWAEKCSGFPRRAGRFVPCIGAVDHGVSVGQLHRPLCGCSARSTRADPPSSS